MNRCAKVFASVVFFGLSLLFCGNTQGQTGIYIPSAKPIKNMQKAMEHPDHF